MVLMKIMVAMWNGSGEEWGFKLKLSEVCSSQYLST